MTAFNRTEFFDTNTTLEAHLAHAIMAYGVTTGGNRFAERNANDNQPFAFYQVGDIFSEAYASKRFMVARVGLILDPNGAASSNPLWAQTLEFPQPVALPNLYRAA